MTDGLNMNRQLLVSTLIDYAGRNHGATEIISTDSSGNTFRSNWSLVAERSHLLASALASVGVKQGDRVGTIAWNDYRHLEAYYGICGMGAVLHTINPRLHDSQIAYIINHAEDQVVLIDPDFIEVAERIAHLVPSVRLWVILGGEAPKSPEAIKYVCYETWINEERETLIWPELDEWAAATLCYTSGTTGNPKGVSQSHRAIVLQSWATCTGDGHNVNSGQSILLAVPMFHVNGWAIPFASAMAGAKLVLPGANLDAAALVEHIRSENVTFSAGVPTIWLSVVQYLESTGKDVPSLKQIAVGGSAAPSSLIDVLEDKYGVSVSHVWGMTEMTQGSAGRFTHRVERLERDEQRKRQSMAGREIYGVELSLIDSEGQKVERDGQTPGELLARGPWVAGSYFRHDDESTHLESEDGSWLRTGDVATINDEGYITIVDRAKDVIKSGGEWISSIDLENAAIAAPSVAEAAVIGLPHDRWGERPLLLVVLHNESELSQKEILDVMKPQVPSWWLPNDIVAIDQIPHTGTGKIDKKVLRTQFVDHSWPAVT
ncbi:MAG: long-chain-fatty-acid--CoA ligase [Actinobacteria bacterium]|nr:long-chain-fatty-acid--CoA ligase [Actinomycetota bacterium]